MKTSTPPLRRRPPSRRAMPLLASALAVLAAFAVLPARAEGIFLCIDANGKRELTDAAKPGCKQLDVPGTINAPPRNTSKAVPVTTPSGFPRVASFQQRQRDNDRRDILTDELRAEERKLAELQKEFNNGEPERLGNEKNYVKYAERIESMRQNVSRSVRNVEALRRELANIK